MSPTWQPIQSPLSDKIHQFISKDISSTFFFTRSIIFKRIIITISRMEPIEISEVDITSGSIIDSSIVVAVTRDIFIFLNLR